MASWPDSGKARTDWPAARAAWAWVCGLEEPSRLMAAIARYLAQDRDLKHGDYGAPGFHRWLAEERWRAWLEPRPGEVAPAVATFDGPPEVEALIVKRLGEATARSALAKAAWRTADRTVVVHTGWAMDRILEHIPPGEHAALNLRFERAPA